MKKNMDKLVKELGINRREFLKRSAQSGVVLGTAPLLTGCFSNHHSNSSNINKEQRTYYFDLSHTERGHTHYLIKGSEMLELDLCTSQDIEQSNNPLLQSIPEGKITHHITYDFHKENIQACYIQTINPNDPKGVWEMSLSFFHLPSASVQRAAVREISSLESSVKLAYYGLDTSVFNGMELHESYLHEDAIKTVTDQAIDLTFHHPEILCMESDSAAHIQKNIIAAQPTTTELAFVLNKQGSASETGGWATMNPYINKDTGKVYLNTKGKKQYFPRYSDTTNTYLGNAVTPSLEKVKNDVTLGVNITDLDSSLENISAKGKLWTINDGFTTVETMLESTSDSGWMTCSNKSKRHGYKATLISADEETGKITLKVENWYYRYLGIYVQFLDSDGKKISLSNIPKSTIESFESGTTSFDTDYNKYALMLSSEFNILGIPIETSVEDFTFIWPEKASSARIIAGGMGQGKEDYEDTTSPAIVLTSIINLAVPSVFLMFAAGTGFIAFVSDIDSLENADLSVLIADVMIEIAADGISVGLLGANPELFIELAKTIGEYLLAKGSTILYEKLTESLTEGEVTDAIPVIGKILAVLAAVGLAVEIATTALEVSNSPSNYSDDLIATHDIEVTIKHDPDDTAGFPAVADYYTLTAMFDNGTPHFSGNISMPTVTVTDPITYTFNNVPYGGKVNITVNFYSNTDNWLAGAGSTGNIDNDVDSTEITIKEILVPLNTNTTYGHKQKMALDEDGKHIWKASSEAPSEKVTSLTCEDVSGNLCNLTGITISEHYGTLGYSWRSDSEAVTSCESGGTGQLNQFSTASSTQDPEVSYTKPSCGFSTPARIIYDLMSSKNNNYYLDTKNGNNYIRQVRLELNGKPSIDKSDSNICWGKFNNPSDALLLHPSRKLISINTALNKIEILELHEEATTDDKAPLAVSYSGRGTRHGLVSGPVAAAVSPQGVILILESGNKRVQAFDTGINPTPYFKKINYHFKLKDETEIVHYTDMAMEHTGYIYILSYTASYVYRLDIYNKDGDFVSRTTGVNADKLTVDLWRNVYSLNYEVQKMPDGTQPTITEPSISQWIPSVP